MAGSIVNYRTTVIVDRSNAMIRDELCGMRFGSSFERWRDSTAGGLERKK